MSGTNTDLREGELMDCNTNAPLTALQGGGALGCMQFHHLVVLNHYTALGK